MMYDFKVSYTVYGNSRKWFRRVVLKGGTIRCKSKETEDQAKSDLELHLRKTILNMHHVAFGVVINETLRNKQADILQLSSAMINHRRK